MRLSPRFTSWAEHSEERTKAVIKQDDIALPSNLNAERAVLGALVEDERLLTAILDDGLTMSDFVLADHQRIFSAICDLRQSGSAIDLITVSNHLGNATYDYALLVDLICGVVIEKSHILHHARIVQRAARLRKLMELGEWLVEVSQEHLADPQFISHTAIEKLQRSEAFS